MSKVITSPVEDFPGTVTLADPLTFPQSIAFEDALIAARDIEGRITRAKAQFATIPGILACVESWDLENFPENVGADNFPSTPHVPSARLIDWLSEEISIIFVGGESVPSEQ